MRWKLGALGLVAAACTVACGGGTEDHAGGSPPSPVAVKVAVGEQLSCVSGTPSTCWGSNPFLQPGSSRGGVFEVGGAAAVAAGRHHACRLQGGQVGCWGSDQAGQLGGTAATETCVDRPCSAEILPVAGLPAATTVAAGGFHTCALGTDGTVWCWGANDLGQLGRGATSPAGAAAPVPGIQDAVALAAGLAHGCAVVGRGAVHCWGDADHGRLGTDTDQDVLSHATEVHGLGGPAVAVAAGDEHTCTLLEDGSVWCWGGNRFGQLGDGGTTARAAPAPVDALGGRAVEVVAGGHFSCARLADGSVSCWGWNDLGQLGQGAFDGPAEPDGFSAALRPVRVSGLPGPASSLAAGAGHACALVAGQAWCWGRNEAGQLGDGSLVDRPIPVAATTTGGGAPPRSGRPPAASSGRGVDVSYHSGRVDWSAVVGSGHDFAFTLSTAGVDFVDPLFSSHWTRMEGLHRGAYHFFVAADDPAQQARWFIANTPLGPGDLAPVVDVETEGDDPPPDLPSRLRVFVTALQEHYGVKPVVYTGPSFWNRALGRGFGDHALWVAEYGVDRPSVPLGWPTWTLWQHAGDATLPGVERVVDLNRVASENDLTALLIPTASGHGARTTKGRE